jgi:hypothetical protein
MSFSRNSALSIFIRKLKTVFSKIHLLSLLTALFSGIQCNSFRTCCCKKSFNESQVAPLTLYHIKMRLFLSTVGNYTFHIIDFHFIIHYNYLLHFIHRWIFMHLI